LTQLRPAAALVAALLVAGCSGTEASLRRDVDGLRSELALVRQENQELQRRLDAVSSRLEVVAARSVRPPEPRPTEPRAAESVVPGGLAVIRVEPGPPAPMPPPPARRAPPIPTAVALVEPDGSRLDALARRSGRELSAEAEAELKAARRKDGLARAHALDDFVARYPRHPQADNALVEAVAAYAEAGRPEAACTMARRAVEEYPAGDALSEALWRLAACELQRGGADAEKRILTRLVAEFPSTPAARKAGERLAAISGRTGGEPPADVPARSGP
jgi:TolA-binding protein